MDLTELFEQFFACLLFRRPFLRALHLLETVPEAYLRIELRELAWWQEQNDPSPIPPPLTKETVNNERNY